MANFSTYHARPGPHHVPTPPTHRTQRSPLPLHTFGLLSADASISSSQPSPPHLLLPAAAPPPSTRRGSSSQPAPTPLLPACPPPIHPDAQAAGSLPRQAITTSGNGADPSGQHHAAAPATGDHGGRPRRPRRTTTTGGNNRAATATANHHDGRQRARRGDHVRTPPPAAGDATTPLRTNLSDLPPLHRSPPPHPLHGRQRQRRATTTGPLQPPATPLRPSAPTGSGRERPQPPRRHHRRAHGGDHGRPRI